MIASRSSTASSRPGLGVEALDVAAQLGRQIVDLVRQGLPALAERVQRRVDPAGGEQVAPRWSPAGS